MFFCEDDPTAAAPSRLVPGALLPLDSHWTQELEGHTHLSPPHTKEQQILTQQLCETPPCSQEQDI